MRYLLLLSALLCLSACSSGSSHSATLTLDNPTWDRVNVQAVITRSSDCDDRQNGYVATDKFIMTKGHSHDVVAPNAETICWRHDRDPNNPVAGDWSGWSRATLFLARSSKFRIETAAQNRAACTSVTGGWRAVKFTGQAQ